MKTSQALRTKMFNIIEEELRPMLSKAVVVKYQDYVLPRGLSVKHVGVVERTIKGRLVHYRLAGDYREGLIVTLDTKNGLYTLNQVLSIKKPFSLLKLETRILLESEFELDSLNRLIRV